MAATESVELDGHVVRLTNPDKVMYPETGTTKRDVLAYYVSIAPWLLPHARGRPATRKRWVDGVGTDAAPGTVFFEKNLPRSAPSWVSRVTRRHSDHDVVYPVVDQVATLAWLAQTAALEIHVPQWRVDGRRSANPDRIVIDLDPGPGAGLPECVVVATAARSLLEDLGLHPVPVTSGSKGIHLYAGLPGTVTSDEVSAVAHELARTLASQLPELVVVDMATALRRGKVLVDWSQNNAAKTTVCPYSLRGRARPTVAAPRTWRELGSPTVRQLEFSEVLRRVRRRGDPLADLGVDGPSAP